MTPTEKLRQKQFDDIYRQAGVKTRIEADDYKDKEKLGKKLLRIHAQAERGPAAEHLRILGAQIRERREKLNLTLKQLAKEAGIDFTNLCNIEQGYANPSYTTLYKLSEALKCELRVEFVRKYTKTESQEQSL